ncbi:MAG: thiamine pyrophosphate-dependent enzyme, partial [Adlercreutzia equolifaciens]
KSIVVTEVGQHQMWAAQHIARERPRSFISSGGLGTMGFGFPAAIGAAIGCPDKTVVCVAGDGSFQMNSQEMATAAINRVPVKVLVMDNRCLGMVHQWQHLFYEWRYASTLLDANPDFVKLADAYGWQAERVERPEDVEGSLARMLAARRGPISWMWPFPRAERLSHGGARCCPRQRHGGDRCGRGRRAHRRARCPGLPGPGGRSCRAGRHLPCAKLDAQFGGRWR